MASSSSSSSFKSWKYDVFLNFRGEDTRKTFVDHLYKALENRLIRTYKDDITLPRGESVGPALLEAIEESHIAVIVFSRNYADSSWCLDELVHIMKCREEMGLTVIPIFYDVDPSEVRYQKREFGEAFSKHEMKNVRKAESWRNALVGASNISGWEPKYVASGHEAGVIQKIVDVISEKLLSSNSDIDEKLVGMTHRVKDLISRLEIGTGGVLMVGIWGIGGGGKTTLATSVYMKIKDRFQGHCIIDNIREESSKHSFKTLQEKLFKGVLKTKVEVQSEEEGKCMIKDRLRHSNLLILLDDVDDRKQLEALVGSHKWFGDGSRIIITTRNENMLQKVDYVSHVRLLSQDEGNLLFKKHAYNDKKPLKDYCELSLRVVSYADGLPLALKVLGSFLYDKDEKEWMSTLDRLKHIPPSEILKQLKISYDGLEPTDKELFLDIACFFRGKSKEGAMEIFEACGFHPDIGIRVLIQKALITINSNGEFDMHDLVQEMGHYIVRGEHPNNPEKHSRVWKDEEINLMYRGDTTMVNDKTEVILCPKDKQVKLVWSKIAYNAKKHPSNPEKHSRVWKDEIISMCRGDTTMVNDKTKVIQCPKYNLDELSWSKIVSNMKKLRWLVVKDRSHEVPTSLSNELRYIEWDCYPGSRFPDSFQPTNLGVLKISWGLQTELWKGRKHLPHLKVLKLEYMKNLVSTPDFDGLPSLQNVEIRQCYKLEEIHPSLGNHRSLKNIRVECSNLKKFPAIDHIIEVEILHILCDYRKFEIPKIQSDMKNLAQLFLYGFTMQAFLSSVAVHCPNLNSLMMNEYTSLTICRGFFSDLNHFSKLDFNLSKLSVLVHLDLSYCNWLDKLPKLPSSLVIFKVDGCGRLTDIGDVNRNCKWLCQVSVREGGILNDGDRLLQFMLEGKAIENHSMVLLLEGLQIPREFQPGLRDGRKCTLLLPEKWCNDFCGFLMCAVINEGYIEGSPKITIKQVSGGSMGIDSEDIGSPKITMKTVRGGSMGIDSEDDVVWKESVDDKKTWVGYVSFGSLRHTATWMDETCKALSFSISIKENNYADQELCHGFGVSLVRRTSGSGPTDTSPPPQYYSKFYQKKYDFKPEFLTTCTFQIPTIFFKGFH